MTFYIDFQYLIRIYLLNQNKKKKIGDNNNSDVIN